MLNETINLCADMRVLAENKIKIFDKRQINQ